MRNSYKLLISLLVLMALLFTAVNLNKLSFAGSGSQFFDRFFEEEVHNIPSPVENIPLEQRQTRDLIVMGARAEAEQGTVYDASYKVIDYPGGDVAVDRGACTDVIIRALRHAGLDLQQLIHEDMLQDFQSYPQNWGLKASDPNIDHRRVPNQMAFMSRQGRTLVLDPVNEPEQWHWGDVVYWQFPNGDQHCGIVSDRVNKSGIPLVIHNAGICTEEDALLRWKIIGHYRYPAD